MAIVCCLIASLVGCTRTATGANAVGPPQSATVGAASAGQVRVLQLNLCNSGIAACYTGRSIDEAAAVIGTESPDLVTLNEICEDDVPMLERVLAGGTGASAFQAARDRDTGDAYRCRNGQRFGNGIVSRWPAVPGTSIGGGIYPAQDRTDPEERAWVCLEIAATPAVAACTTHLADTDREVALDQCKYLFGTVIAELRARAGAPPLVLGGDLNLVPADNADVRDCLPAGSAFVDDGAVQLVVSTPELVAADARTIDLRGSTDHAGLLVTLTAR